MSQFANYQFKWSHLWHYTHLLSWHNIDTGPCRAKRSCDGQFLDWHSPLLCLFSPASSPLSFHLSPYPPPLFRPSSLSIWGSSLSSRWPVSQQRLFKLFDTIATGFENNTVTYKCKLVHKQEWTHARTNVYFLAHSTLAHIREYELGYSCAQGEKLSSHAHTHAHSCDVFATAPAESFPHLVTRFF